MSDDLAVLRRAISDPGHVLPRERGYGADGRGYEGVPQWAARAVLARGYVRLDADTLRAALDDLALLVPAHVLEAPNSWQPAECVDPDGCARCALERVWATLDHKPGRLSSTAQGMNHPEGDRP